ncbi:MAG: NUDIX hydrolase [Chloroflexi bacterium]|nr:NUDIX hydrolase [Chloroflexota bacterium]
MSEKILSSEYPYRGKIVNLRLDHVEIDDGRKRVVVREVVEHRGAVAMVALDARNRVLMVRQFRSGAQTEMLEIPAGTLETGEDPAACAARELEEETGYHAKKWKSLGMFYSSPGFCTEKMYLYAARQLVAAHTHPDEDEVIRAEWVPLRQALQMVARGEIMDGKSIVGLQRVGLTRRRQKKAR